MARVLKYEYRAMFSIAISSKNRIMSDMQHEEQGGRGCNKLRYALFPLLYD